MTDIQAECAVVSSQSTPLGRCGSLTPFTVTAKYDCHRNWDAACHIFNLHGRGIWGCGTEGTISTWAHFSRHPPSIYPSNPPTMCLLPTTHNQVTKENHTHVLKHTLTVSRADLKAGAETLESNGSFYKIFLHYVFIPITHISATSVIHTTALHIFTICISLKWK